MNESMILTLKNKEVVYAILAGEGALNKFKQVHEYKVGMKFTKKEKDKFVEEVMEFWEENKPSKAKDPKTNPADWFSKKDEDDFYVLWVSTEVENKLTRKRAPGTDFTLKHFETIGAGSVLDVEVRIFIFDNTYGSGLGIRLTAVQLNEYKKFTGSGGASLDGETLEDDGIVEAPAEEKKKKKKKKK